MSLWTRIAENSDGAITEEELERAAVRLDAYQVIYANDHGSRHAYDLVTTNLSTFRAAFAPFGRTVLHRPQHGYVVVLGQHRVSQRMPLTQTRFAIVLRRLYDDKMRRADIEQGEIVCDVLELQQAWTEYLQLEWKFRLGELDVHLSALRRYGILSVRKSEEQINPIYIVIRPAIEDVIGEQVLHQLAQYGAGTADEEGDQDETA